MDKEKATKILSKELTKIKGQKFIVNSAYQKHVLEKAVSVYEISHEKPFSLQTYVSDLNNLTNEDIGGFIEEYKSKIIENCSKVDDANYVFTEHFENLSQTRSHYGTLYSYLTFTNTFSFFALIMPQDAEEIRNLFYKDVSPEVVEAMDSLSIKHFVNDYNSYKKDRFFERLEELKLGKKFVDYFINVRGDREGEVPEDHIASEVGGIELLNNSFRKLGIEATISKIEDRKSDIGKYPSYVHTANLSKVANQLHKVLHTNRTQISGNFSNFVFTLPYEDQNIEANKSIFKHSPASFDYTHFLVQEYSGGRHFQDYFDCLDAERQKKVVDSLKSVPVKNSAHNSFLWKKGFKDVDVDYMALYKADSESFIDYFAGRTTDEKRIILKDIMDSDFVNEKVTVWLNDGYLDLMREVGFNG